MSIQSEYFITMVIIMDLRNTDHDFMGLLVITDLITQKFLIYSLVYLNKFEWKMCKIILADIDA